MIRAGLLPFYVDEDDTIHILLMRPSDPRYGGTEWQIAKGIAETDDIEAEGIREGVEELGITQQDMMGETFYAASSLKKFRDGSRHSLFVYTVRTKAKSVSGHYHYETGDTIWLPEYEIHKVRDWQQPLVEIALRRIRARI